MRALAALFFFVCSFLSSHVHILIAITFLFIFSFLTISFTSLVSFSSLRLVLSIHSIHFLPSLLLFPSYPILLLFPITSSFPPSVQSFHFRPSPAFPPFLIPSSYPSLFLLVLIFQSSPSQYSSVRHFSSIFYTSLHPLTAILPFHRR